MHVLALVFTLLITLAAASPVPAAAVSKKPYIAVSLNYYIDPPRGNAYVGPGPTEVCLLLTQVMETTDIEGTS